MHVGTADVPWVENVAHPGTWFRLLQADLSVGLYTMHGRMGAGLAVGTHRHHGAVHMFTLSGSWRYREHGFLNTAGQFVQVDNQTGINHFPAQYRRPANFLRATDAYAPRQVQIALKLIF